MDYDNQEDNGMKLYRISLLYKILFNLNQTSAYLSKETTKTK